jgi:hypothetical protein
MMGKGMERKMREKEEEEIYIGLEEEYCKVTRDRGKRVIKEIYEKSKRE